MRQRIFIFEGIGLVTAKAYALQTERRLNIQHEQQVWSRCKLLIQSYDNIGVSTAGALICNG